MAKRKKTKPKPRKKKKIIVPTQSIRRGTCEQTYKDYKSERMIGGGEFGDVYLMCNEAKQCPFVVKVYWIGGDEEHELHTFAKFEQEVKMQRIAAKLKIAPKVYDAWTCDTEGKARRYYYKDEYYIVPFQAFNVMDRMDGSLTQFVRHIYGEDTDQQPAYDRVPRPIRESWYKQVETMVKKFNKIGLRHGSIGPPNILYKKRQNDLTGKNLHLYLGDFEEARHLDGSDEKIVGPIGTNGTDEEQLKDFRQKLKLDPRTHYL